MARGPWSMTPQPPCYKGPTAIRLALRRRNDPSPTSPSKTPHAAYYVAHSHPYTTITPRYAKTAILARF